MAAPFDDAGMPLLVSLAPHASVRAIQLPLLALLECCNSTQNCAGAGAEAGGQEATSRLADIAASVKAFIFYTTTFLLALPLFAVMLALTPFVLLFDKHRRLAQHSVNDIWAKISTFLYYRVQVGPRKVAM